MQEDHHFCRWHLPEGFSAEAALAAAFPGASRAQAAHQLDTCSPKELREVFAVIFGSATTSNNTSWIRQKLKGALGLGSKKPRAANAAGGRKRSAGPPEASGGCGKQARAASPDTLPTGSHWGGGFGAASGRHLRMGRSPSSDWDRFSLEEWDTEDHTADSSAAVAGAATLLAAAAEVESREAAAGAAAGRAGRSQRGASLAAGAGATGIAGGLAGTAQAGQPSPDSPGGSATGSSLSAPPADASQQVQAFLQGFLRVAQVAGTPAPAVAAMPATGALPAVGAAVAAGQAQGPAQGPALPSFLTQLSPVGQQTAVYRLLAALAAAPNGHPM